ncbi:MAG TPA: polysaccharide deacetylase family protein, partial [Nitrososphaeraceae archaeon]|nr:polysaccharide deacetylase family protein [Nitrososphaeraceae archaeon]
MKYSTSFSKLLPILAMGFLMAFVSVLSNEHAFASGIPTKSTESKRTVDKVVIFIFSDGLKSQFANAKPILDKYGFKGTFDVVCNYVDTKNGYMDWDEIKVLHNEGHDIGSHSMTHVRLTDLPKESIEYEVGESKKCLDDYGITPTSFEYPFSTGSEDKDIVDIVAKHYEFATRGNDPLMFLKCDGLTQYGQEDCKTFADNGTPTYANKYSIRNWSHDFEIVENSYSESEALDRFIEVVNSQSKYNNDGSIDAIPIIMYHDIGDEGSITNVDLFEKEMKYLHDNNFHVITISDLSYNEDDHHLYVKDIALEPELPAENVTTPIVEPTENITSDITSPVQEPEINATANVTAPVQEPEINATANVTAPVQEPEITATANVTAPV